MKNKNNIISIHSLHTEGDTAFLGRWNGAGHFNPLPPHGGRPGLYKTVRFQKSISIHSLHTEGDFLELMGGLTEEISIHSLHTEGDTSADAAAIAGRGFQSTPSTRRETPTHLQSVPRRKKFQSTPSTRRETLRSYRTCWKAGISIHSLHTEGDVDYTAREVAADISIHSLHTEGDAFCVLSTRPVFHISIHSLHTEGDAVQWILAAIFMLFQSTPSTRRETRLFAKIDPLSKFQSTPSTRRETVFQHIKFIVEIVFQSTPSTRRETEIS